ncbi:MAG: tripartite tricarboxylate transporter permease [Geminicoccaceae bacterium]
MLDPALLANALAIVLDPWNLLVLVLGVIFGIVVGIIPGLSSTMAVALLIPFTFAMQPEAAMSLLVAVFVGGISGGAVTAILIRMPGTPASVATTLDGFPMAQKGLAGQAIGHAAVASMIGTVISGFFLVVTAPMLAEFALKFYFADYVAVCVFALTAVIAISGDRLIRGVVTATVGLLAATVGISAEDGLPRFDFGVPAMMSGVDLIPALIGFFAVSQIMHEVAGPDRVKFDGDLRRSIGRVLPGLGEMRRNTFNYLRSALIGTVVGVIPAVGGGPAGLIAYAQAKNSSKTPEKFGTGVPEGVIASETANNATVGGALIIA